jgi:peptide/nickel transport system permease protein
MGQAQDERRPGREVQAPVAVAPRLVEEEETARIFVASQWKLMYWRFRKHKLAVASFFVLCLLYFVAIFAEFVAPYDPNKQNTKLLFVPPRRVRFVDREGKLKLRPFVYGLTQQVDMETLRKTYVEDEASKLYIRFFVHGDPYKLWGLFESDLHLFGLEGNDRTLFLLGSDRMGRDLFSRVIHGSRISLSVGLLGISISLILGVIIGGISGYYGGMVDAIVQRTIEFLRSMPTIPLWMALAAALPTDWSPLRVYFCILIILSLIGWTGLARVVRGRFLSLREEDFVMAARLAGASEWRIIMRHLVPSFLSYLIAHLTLAIPGMILGETALSFLGVGLRPPVVSWGVTLNEAQQLRVVAQAPWLLLPGAFIVLAVLAFNFVGDGLRDAADPYAR